MKRRSTRNRVRKARRARAPGADRFALPAECTLADAGALRARLKRLIAHPRPLTLDGSFVERIDTATMQVLIAFVRDRRERGLPVMWHGDAPAFTEAATLLGIHGLLGLPDCAA